MLPFRLIICQFIGSQIDRVVKVIDSRSISQMRAWVRIPYLTKIFGQLPFICTKNISKAFCEIIYFLLLLKTTKIISLFEIRLMFFLKIHYIQPLLLNMMLPTLYLTLKRPYVKSKVLQVELTFIIFIIKHEPLMFFLRIC